MVIASEPQIRGMHVVPRSIFLILPSTTLSCHQFSQRNRVSHTHTPPGMGYHLRCFVEFPPLPIIKCFLPQKNLMASWHLWCQDSQSARQLDQKSGSSRFCVYVEGCSAYLSPKIKKKIHALFLSSSFVFVLLLVKMKVLLM